MARLDQYYTQRSLTKRLVASLNFDQFDIVLEPSAGDGAFFDYLPKSKRLGIDLEPAAPYIRREDFFNFNAQEGKSYFVVGNPPFGKNSSLAKSFFNRAAGFADKIAFVLPRTFRKLSIINNLDKNFWLISEELLPQNSFYLPNGEQYCVPCVFQVWERRDTQREKIILPTTHQDWEWVKRDNADFAIRRVGVKAGKVYKDFSTLADPSHYFVKQKSPIVFNKLDKLWATYFSPAADPQKLGVKWDTAGNPSLSKSELILYYEKLNCEQL